MFYVYSEKHRKYYYLHGRPGPAGGLLYFFSTKPEGAIASVPDGHYVGINVAGFPQLFKNRGDGLDPKPPIFEKLDWEM